MATSRIRGVNEIKTKLTEAIADAVKASEADGILIKNITGARAHGMEGVEHDEAHRLAKESLSADIDSFAKKVSDESVKQLKDHGADLDKAVELSVKDTEAFTKTLIKELETRPRAFIEADKVEALVKETFATDKVIAETFEASEEAIKALSENAKAAVPEAVGMAKQFGNWMSRPFQRMFKGEAAELLEVTEANGKKILTPLTEELSFAKASGGGAVRAAVVGVPVILAGKMLFGGKSEPEEAYTYSANENTPREGGFAAAEESRRAEAASAEMAR